MIGDKFGNFCIFWKISFFYYFIQHVFVEHPLNTSTVLTLKPVFKSLLCFGFDENLFIKCAFY